MEYEADSRSTGPASSEDRSAGPLTRSSEIHTLPIASIMPGISPRSSDDEEHARRLAETEAELPPILVHRETMRIIDGMHRLMAAVLKGRKEIEAVFFDGSEDDAFVRAVEENIAHGLPLSLADRKAAALRIMGSHPQLSDRAIAAYTGLAAKTVRTIRPRSTTDSPQLNIRIGSDGRFRPLSGAEGRRRASEVITRQPDAPLREIAKIAGVSVGTAHDVRSRIRRGEDPVPAGSRTSRKPAEPDPQPSRPPPSGHSEFPAAEPAVRRNDTGGPSVSLQKLIRDPALRHTEPGRELLRMLHRRTISVDDWSRLVDSVPTHCTSAVVELARRCAETWDQFARELERRGSAIG